MKLSIVILTYKRQDELLRTLQSIRDHGGAGLEIIVVNNDADRIDMLLKEKFPEVRCLSMEENKGCAARNAGAAAAAGDIVITLDNDVNLKTQSFAEEVVKFFREHPAAGCVNFRVLNPEGALSLRDWCHPRDYAQWAEREFPTDHISEGASAFKREAFLAAGGYYAPFFIGHEGPDLSLRLMKAGHEVWYAPHLEVVHYASPAARPGSRAYYFNTRNNIWLAYRHYPTVTAVKYVGYYTAMMFLYSLKDIRFGSFFRGLLDAVLKLNAIKRERLTTAQMIMIRRLWEYKPSILSRLKKHLNSKQKYR